MITQDIRESVLLYLPTAEFSYGRKFDTAVEASKIKVNDYFVALDPISIRGSLLNKERVATISIAFLKLDSGDSNYDNATNVALTDSIEKIQDDSITTAELWANYFQNVWSKNNNNQRYMFGEISFNGLTRVKDMMSGVLASFTLTYKVNC